MGLKIKNITKSFEEKKIFSDFSYDFEETGVYAILGESGVGKTTFLRMICGLDNDFSGEIQGGGIKNCSIAFQEYRLFPTLSAIDNIVFANYDKKDAENTEEATQTLVSLGFSKSDANLYPVELSGGMKQRVSLARAFLRNTPILLLDEPTKELDEENTNRVLDMISSEAKKRLVILVTHSKRDCEALNAKILNLTL